jgi:GNAT superfamily N-acetyltransferase
MLIASTPAERGVEVIPPACRHFTRLPKGHPMPSTPNLLLRDARPDDRATTVDILAAAFAGGAVARWLQPDDGHRLADSIRHFSTRVDNALARGVVRIAEEHGRIVGAALWFPRSGDPAAANQPRTGLADLPSLGRRRLLERLLDERHPTAPAHHHLAFIGVRPDRQNHGIGTCLLIGHHAFLHVAGMPAYLEADDPRNRELYLRHGYCDVGPRVLLPTGIPIWPMWRSPEPAGVEPRTWPHNARRSPARTVAR